ncbi:redoxin domain-containing protein, partial [Priestia megaterium]|uniref:redoxin domain-containing protein n=1 Tax=Priestia megaterium TaxID=1404 RepID=UPI0021C22949
NFWGRWWKGCKEEMRGMEKEYGGYKKEGVEILGVKVGERNIGVEEFGKEYGLCFGILMDKD